MENSRTHEPDDEREDRENRPEVEPTDDLDPDDGCRRIEADLRRFIGPLNAWIRPLLSNMLPPDWRQRLGAYLDSWEPEGFEVDPPERRKLERWIENWAKLLYVWPAIETSTSARHAPERRVQLAAMQHAPHRPTQREIDERFFNSKLAIAEKCLAQIEPLLVDLGTRIESAQLESDVDVDPVADQAYEVKPLGDGILLALDDSPENWQSADYRGM